LALNEIQQEAQEAYRAHGTQQAAADALGIHVSTLQRRLKSIDQNSFINSILEEEATQLGIDIDDVQYAWVKTDDVSMMVRRKDVPSYEEIRDSFIEEMKNYAPVYEKIPYYSKGEHLLVVDPADVHIGKLAAALETGYDYDIQEAERRVQEGIVSLANKAAVHGISRIVFVLGNDIIHTDNTNRTTTAGTPQDTQGQWWQMFTAAKRVYIKAIETLTQFAPVHLVYCPSNHDYKVGFFLADSVFSWFSKNPNVSAGEEQKSISINHRKYVVFGNNLLMFTHGDGAKEKDIPNLMQYEAREAWGQTRFAYAYTHHFHHKIRNVAGLNPQKLEKDHIGITVLQSSRVLNPANNVYIEYVRSPSPSDGWHHRNGYINEQAIEVFLHHPDRGQIARFTEFF
jgi:DNA-binding Lrp family transcriptional regulator